MIHGSHHSKGAAARRRRRGRFTRFYTAFTALYIPAPDNRHSNQHEDLSMKRNHISAYVLGLAALSAAHGAFAQPIPPQPGPGEHGPMGMERGPGGPGMHRRGGMPFLHGVQLSETQQDRVFAIMHAQAPAQRELEKKIRAAHEALRGAGASAQFDEARASAQAQALGQAVAAEALLRARTEAQVFAVLTPEQREQAARAREQRHPR
jgi:Spy/CpxP family protein refolding chaperone